MSAPAALKPARAQLDSALRRFPVAQGRHDPAPASPFMPARRPRRSPCAAVLLALAPPSQAQYKVIGADGKVTYTDREPTANEGRVSALGARAGRRRRPSPTCRSSCARSASKYPVTLYTATGACEPCAQAAHAPEAARRSVQRAPGRQHRGQRRAREARRLARGADADDRLAVAARPGQRHLELVPRRRRLSARLAPAEQLPVPAGDADRRAPRSGVARGGARRRRRRRGRRTPARRAAPAPAASASSARAAPSALSRAATPRRRRGAPPGCRCRPPRPSARTAPRRRASRRPVRRRAA